MESLIDRWTQMRRSERGLVFGNVCYFALGGCSLTIASFLEITTEVSMLPLACVYYGVWCVCSALLVEWLGEKVGMITCFLLLTFLALLYSYIMLSRLRLFQSVGEVLGQDSSPLQRSWRIKNSVISERHAVLVLRKNSIPARAD